MADLLPILGIETTGELCSVAVMPEENSFVEFNYLQKHIHSEKLVDMIGTILTRSEIDLRQIKAIAVSIGPGSFTGLRIGLSAAKGLALGSNLPLVPVPTFSAYAMRLAEYLPYGEKFGIVANASIDEIYFAEFMKKGSLVEVATELKLIEKSSLESEYNGAIKIFGEVAINGVIKSTLGPTASAICKWAYLFGKDLLTFNYDYLEPNYFKKFIPKVAR